MANIILNNSSTTQIKTILFFYNSGFQQFDHGTVFSGPQSHMKAILNLYNDVIMIEK